MDDQPFWMEPKEVTLKDGTKVTLVPEVELLLEPTREMFSSLSEETLEFLPIPITRERVEGWFNDIDFEKNLPILGIDEQNDSIRVIASANLMFFELDLYKHRAVFGITVHDDYQDRGLGTILTQYMIDIARSKGLKKVDLMVVAHNARAIRVYKKMGFEVEGHLRMNHYNHILDEYCDEYKMGLILED